MLKVTVAGKRKREVGLVVPGKYCAFTKKKALARVLDQEIERRKEKYSHLELYHAVTDVYRMFSWYDLTEGFWLELDKEIQGELKIGPT